METARDTRTVVSGSLTTTPAALVGVELVAADLAVGLLHEVLELILEVGVPGGSVNHALLWRTAPGEVLLGLRLLGPGLTALALRRRGIVRRLLDGEIDLPLRRDGEDPYLHRLSDLEIVVHVRDIF